MRSDEIEKEVIHETIVIVVGCDYMLHVERRIMKESLRINYIVIGVSITVIILIAAIGAGVSDSKNNKTLATVFGGIIIFSLGVILFSVLGIIRKNQTNRTLSQSPYNFIYSQEYVIYRSITKTKKDWAIKRIEKRGIVFPKRYTSWKDGLLERYKSLIDNEDFFHFLNYKVRCLKDLCDGIAIITTPLEIGVMTVFLSAYVSKGGNLVLAILSAAFLLAVLTVEYERTRSEISFIEDVISVLCPKCVKID